MRSAEEIASDYFKEAVRSDRVGPGLEVYIKQAQIEVLEWVLEEGKTSLWGVLEWSLLSKLRELKKK